MYVFSWTEGFWGYLGKKNSSYLLIVTDVTATLTLYMLWWHRNIFSAVFVRDCQSFYVLYSKINNVHFNINAGYLLEEHDCVYNISKDSQGQSLFQVERHMHDDCTVWTKFE